jgi:outer membrane protein assembly factor BamC
LQEVLVGQQKDSTIWTPRPSEPELEAEFLSRLMARLGSEASRAKTVVATVAAPPARAKLVANGSGKYLEVDESFDRAWRRVGLALDRVGFTVEDRDRSQGTYFVRYVDPDKDAQKGDKGFLSRLFSFGGDNKGKSSARYRVSVKGSGTISQVGVLNNDGQPERTQTGDKILSLLKDQLQ